MAARKKTKRKHTRIPFTGQVDLYFPDRNYTGCRAGDLCLSGIWVVGSQPRSVGERCEVEFHDVGVLKNRSLRLEGEVVRVDDEGLALLFVDMNMRTYSDLETIVLDQTDDVFEAADSFLDEVEIQKR